MNLKATTAVSLAVLISAFSFDIKPAEAGPNNVNKRQKNQNQRIRQGIKNGSLNKNEANRLLKQQAKLRRQEAKMRASGGSLNAKEREILKNKQDQLSKNIQQQKNDQNFRKNGPNKNDLFDINKTQANHNRRIQQGIKSGSLTEKEAAKLQKKQEKFAEREAKLRQGGLTLKERAKLEKHQDNLSNQIKQQKSDNQTR